MNRKISVFIYLSFWFNIANGLSCVCSPCNEHLNTTCEIETKGKCFALKYEHEDGSQHLIFGCITQENIVVPQLANFVSPLHPRAIDYCDDEDFCNNNLQPLLHITSHSSTDFKLLIGCLFGSLSVFLVVLSYSSLYQFRLHSARDTNDILEVNFDKYPPTKDERFKDYPREMELISKGKFTEVWKATYKGEYAAVKDVDFDDSTSAIEAISKFTNERFENSPHAIELISKGKFTEVWKAIYKGEYVAVKVWNHDVNISSLEMVHYKPLVHKNILRFIGREAVMIRGIKYDDMIITAYHANRDLSTFLHTNIIDLRTMINMAFDISSGLKYLHSLPFDKIRIYKPKILHVYLESRNIFVKDDLTCCIGDFSGALYPSEFNKKRPDKVRYLAPELLMGEKITKLKTDNYSVSLVFWEMARRCNACGIPKEYQLPYFKDVSSDPSKEEMIEVVCTRGIRPLIEPRWLTNKTLSEFVYLMTSNWQLEPTNRMRSSHIKRKLAKLRVVLGKSSWLSLFQ